MSHKYPWCEWSISLKDGAVTGVVSVQLQTRDDVRKQLPLQLPDDDRIAAKHIRMLREGVR